MGAYHAKLSPSSADRWTSCTASVGAQEGLPNEGSEAARLGTVCHQICEEVLSAGADPQRYIGREMWFWSHPESDSAGEDWADELLAAVGGAGDPSLEYLHLVRVTQEMVDAVVSATEYVKSQHALFGGQLYAEQQVPIGHFTGEPDARGTTDVVMLSGTGIHVMDFKFGRHKVHAYEVVTPAHRDIITGATVPEVRRPNLQMACYALGALEKYKEQDFTYVTLTIVQPFIGHVSECTFTVKELLAVRDFLAAKAEETRTRPQFVPSSANCHFCRASGNCAAQTKAVVDAALDGFDDVSTASVKKPSDETLGTLYAVIPLVQNWCKAVEARVRDSLQQGRPVLRNDGLSYKLVAGRSSARQWEDPAAVETTFKQLGLSDELVYVKDLISPATAEKLAKAPRVKKGETPVTPAISPAQWVELQGLITQGQCQPAIALETDPRPSIADATDGFEDVPPADNSDLF